MREVKIGETLVCNETKKEFVAARDGCTTNYAQDSEGNVYSEEGVDIRERRSLLDRSLPYFAYVSSDGKHITGWKGNVLMSVYDTQKTALPFGRSWDHTHGKDWTLYRAKDVHGALWSGKGSPGIYIKMRPVGDK